MAMINNLIWSSPFTYPRARDWDVRSEFKRVSLGMFSPAVIDES